MKKVLFLIRSLNAGGAERQLVITAKGLSERGYDVSVLTFYSGGFYAHEFDDSNVQLLSLHKKGRWDFFPFIFRLVFILRQQSPDVLYSFMTVANILSVLISPFIRTSKIVWGVRASNMDLANYDWLSRWSYFLECRLSCLADRIIANSNAGADYAIENGFPKKKLVVIPNGINTKHFKPEVQAGKLLRQEWGVAEDEVLIGVVGRIDPMKGYPIFLRSASVLQQSDQKLKFVCVGIGKTEYEKELHLLGKELKLDSQLIWAGRHADMRSVYNAFDIAVSSSSFGEGFPNVLGEAMACAVPCVVTDVGDSALVVGETGFIVPANDVKNLSVALNTMLSLDVVQLARQKKLARKRIKSNFSTVTLLDATEKTLLENIA